MDISIIIPTYNEEKYLAHTLDSISQFIPDQYNYEIIIVDNNSTDNTANIAKKYNTILLEGQMGNIGSLRNIGVKHSSGKILIFLDADIALTESWMNYFPITYNNLLNNPNIVTGSTAGISEDANWIEKHWFQPLLNRPLGHINSGHLIVTRTLFDSIAGFDNSLVTGEDHDFSVRAKTIGADIQDNQKLYVCHEGYPKNIKEFFFREAWHGMGDFQSINNFFSSYVAILSILIVFLILYLFFSLLITQDYKTGLLSLVLILSICIIVTTIKYKTLSIRTVVVNTFLYHVYFVARAFSLLKVLLSKPSYKRHRHNQ